jgi:hypothetical protein
VEQLPSLEDFLLQHMLAAEHGTPVIITGGQQFPPSSPVHLPLDMSHTSALELPGHSPA